MTKPEQYPREDAWEPTERDIEQAKNAANTDFLIHEIEWFAAFAYYVARDAVGRARSHLNAADPIRQVWPEVVGLLKDGALPCGCSEGPWSYDCATVRRVRSRRVADAEREREEVVGLLEDEPLPCGCSEEPWGCDCGNSGDTRDEASAYARNGLRAEIRTALAKAREIEGLDHDCTEHGNPQD